MQVKPVDEKEIFPVMTICYALGRGWDSSGGKERSTGGEAKCGEINQEPLF